MRSLRILAGAVVALGCGWAFGQPPAPLKTVPLQPPPSFAEPYVPQKLLSGEIKLVGSRTMSQLAAVWTDGFTYVHREVKPAFDFQGSSSVFEQLKGDAPIVGLLSRNLTADDQETFAKANPGLKLVEVDVAFDALAVIVHKDNPVKGLSFSDLKVLYSAAAEEPTWDDVGLLGEFDKAPVVRLIPGEGSGARGAFVARVFGEKAETAKITSHEWHTKIVDEVAANKGGVGVVSFANSRSDKVRVVPISIKPDGPFVPLSAENVASGRYPLIRPLSVIVVADDKGVKNPLAAELVRYVLSRHGQDDVVKDGFSPLSRAALLKQYDQLRWNSVK